MGYQGMELITVPPAYPAPVGALSIPGSSTLPVSVFVRSKRKRCVNCATQAALKCCVASWTT